MLIRLLIALALCQFAGRAVAAEKYGFRGASADSRAVAFTSGRDIVIPQVADGGGWSTSIILMNPGSVSTNVAVAFYGDDGTPLPLPFTGTNNERYPVLLGSIGPGETLMVDTSNVDSATKQGWAIVGQEDDTALVTGMAVFRLKVPGRPDFEAVVPFSPFDETEFAMPYDNRNGFSTGIALVNPDEPDSPTSTVSFTFLDPDGAVFLQESVTLAGGVHTAFALPTRWSALANRQGMVIVRTTGRQLSALGLRFNPGGAFTSFHALSLPRTVEAPPPPTTIPPSLPGMSSSCATLEGVSIFAQDSTFLGTISSDKYSSTSIANQYGTYGSSYSPTSIFNRNSTYGSDTSSESPFNKGASQPPILFKDGGVLAYLTTSAGRTPRVDPYIVLQCVGRTR